MDKELQDKFRAEIIEKYKKHAWEALGKYDYFGQEYTKVNKSIADLAKRRDEALAKAREIDKQPDYHTVENKNKIKALREDADRFNKQIKSVETFSRRYWEEAVKWREEGVRFLEEAANFETFTLKTVEEIEKDKITPPVPAEIDEAEEAK